MVSKSLNKQVLFFSDVPHLVISSACYNEDLVADQLRLFFGDIQNKQFFTDKVEDKQVKIIYGIEETLPKFLSSKFPQAESLHLASGLLQSKENEFEGLQIVCFQNRFLVKLIQDQQLLFMQQMEFKTAEDVCYHLLNICKQSEVKDPEINISGMIESNSPLLVEIEKYFSRVLLNRPAPGTFAPSQNQPEAKHYFTHLFSLSL